MCYKINVYGTTKDIANIKLKNILKSIPYDTIYEIRNDFDQLKVVLKNKCIYRAVGIKHAGRTMRWDYAYIDKKISELEYGEIILPCFRPTDKIGMLNAGISFEDRIEWF